MTKTPDSPQRDYQLERHSTHTGQNQRIRSLAERRAFLGDEIIKMPHALAMCGLPYVRTTQRQIQRRAHIGQNDWMYVTFTAGVVGIDLPFGYDRRLLDWIADTAIKLDSPVIPWKSNASYCHEMGLALSGRNYEDLRESFKRVRGLVVHVQRVRREEDRDPLFGSDALFPIIESVNVPKSLVGKKSSEPIHPSLHGSVGMKLSNHFFEEIRRNPRPMYRDFWRELDAPLPISDLVKFLWFRCYEAKSDSRITWAQLADQFDAGSNPKHFHQNVRRAVEIVLYVFSGFPNLRVDSLGLMVGPAFGPPLPDDKSKKRFFLKSS